MFNLPGFIFFKWCGEIKISLVYKNILIGKAEIFSILAVFPDIEQFLEEDIMTKSFLDKITDQYLQSVELPQFELIRINANSLEDLK